MVEQLYTWHASYPVSQRAHLTYWHIKSKMEAAACVVYSGPVEASTPAEVGEGSTKENWPEVGHGILEYGEVKENNPGGGQWARDLELKERVDIHLNMKSRRHDSKLVKALCNEYMCTPSRSAVLSPGHASLSIDLNVTFGLEGYRYF